MTSRFLLNGSMCSLFIFESVFLQLFEERAVILVLNQDLGKLIFVHEEVCRVCLFSIFGERSSQLSRYFYQRAAHSALFHGVESTN